MPNPFVCKQTFCMKYSLLGSEYCAKHRPDEPDPNGFELQDDGTVTSAGNTSNTLKTQLKTLSDDELREYIKYRFGMDAREDWYDQFRYDDRVLLLDYIKSYGDTRYKEGEIDGRIDERRKNKWLPDEAKWIEKEADRLAELKKMKGEV